MTGASWVRLSRPSPAIPATLDGSFEVSPSLRLDIGTELTKYILILKYVKDMRVVGTFTFTLRNPCIITRFGPPKYDERPRAHLKLPFLFPLFLLVPISAPTSLTATLIRSLIGYPNVISPLSILGRRKESNLQYAALRV